MELELGNWSKKTEFSEGKNGVKVKHIVLFKDYIMDWSFGSVELEGVRVQKIVDMCNATNAIPSEGDLKGKKKIKKKTRKEKK